jgi:alginate O-acetyltransferase complex protein AlgI
LITGADVKNLPAITLPIGISFYTFQILTYTIDIYFGKTPVQRSFVKFLLYESLFPQLIAGPIVRYADVEEQLTQRSPSFEKFANGAVLFVCGLCKKVILADQIGAAADIFLRDTASGGTFGAWFGISLYAFQIYFDFAGYSDMAIGLGRLFGFEFKINFDYPYISKSVTEFWRRWHISLGTFFRDYVYIPLGGNRRAHVRNILVVWLLTGLWHGASWNFALGGLYYGVLLLIKKYIFSRIKVKPPAAVKVIYTLFTVLIGWVLFYYTDISAIGLALRVMFGYSPTDLMYTVTASENVLLFAICAAASTPAVKLLYMRGLSAVKHDGARAVCDTVLKVCYISAGLLICTSQLVGSSFSPFLYFRF